MIRRRFRRCVDRRRRSASRSAPARLSRRRRSKPAGADDGDDGGFDPDAMVDAIWDSKVIPYLSAKAGPLPEVVALARSNPDEAGRKFGYRAKEGSEPWTFVVKIDGRIVAAETASRARRRSASTTKATAKSPRSSRSDPRCAARRCAIRSISSPSTTSRIRSTTRSSARRSISTSCRRSCRNLPRDSLVGRNVTALGAFTLEAGDQPPLVDAGATHARTARHDRGSATTTSSFGSKA